MNLLFRGATVRLCFALSCGIGIGVTPALAQHTQSTVDRFEEWKRKLVLLGGDNTHLDGLSIKYDVRWLYVPPEPELSQLRREVAGHPEHPRLRELAMYERRLTSRDAREQTLWRWKGRWRFNGNSVDDPTRYNDLVWGDGVAWVLNPKSLVILNPATAHQHPFGLPKASSGFSDDCFLLCNGGIGAAVLNSVEVVPQLVSASTWIAQGSGVDGADLLSVEAKGTWNEIDGWGTVDEFSFIRTTPRGKHGYRVETREWRHVAQVRMGMAGWAKVVDLFPTHEAPSFDREVRLLQTSPFTGVEFAELANRPAMNGHDVVRGRVTFRSVVDLSGAAPVVDRFDERGERLAGFAPPSEPALGVESKLRVLGWVMAGSAFTAIGVIVIRRRMSSPR